MPGIATACGETVGLLQRHGDALLAHGITDVVAFEDGSQLLADVAGRRRQVIQAVLAF